MIFVIFSIRVLPEKASRKCEVYFSKAFAIYQKKINPFFVFLLIHRKGFSKTRSDRAKLPPVQPIYLRSLNSRRKTVTMMTNFKALSNL